MRNSSRIKRVGLILLVAGLAVGCGMYKKRSANKAIEKAERESVQQATNAQAPVYASDAFNTLRQQIAQAKRYVEEGQYDQAMTLVKDAEAQAAKAIREAGKTKVEVDQRVQSIEKILAEAEDKIAKSKAVEAPSLAGQVESAEQQIGKVRELLTQQKTGAQEPKKYDAVIADASTAEQEASRVYDLVLEGEALAMEARIRTLREQAQGLEPSKYIPEEAARAMEAWSALDLLMQSQKYAGAIEAGKAVEESLPQFIETAGKMRAEKTIEQAQSDRDGATAQGAGVYALETLRVAEAALARAKSLFEEKDYGGAFEAATSAIEQSAASLEEVRAEAGKAVDLSKEKVAEAETEGAGEFASDLLREARQYRADGALAYERKSYLESLQASEKALERAGAAITSAKRGKAEQALLRTGRTIRKAVEQDAAKYVPEEFIDAKATYDSADQAFRDGDFAGVHTLSKEAEDKAIQVIASLREKTTEYIRSAENAVELARVAEAPTLVEEEFKKSVNMLTSSREKLAEESYKVAIEGAEEAERSATAARSTAFRIRSEAKRAVAAEEIDAANKSGAATFAPTVLGNALDALSRSEKEYKAGGFEAALSDASEAESLAVRARMTLLDEAQGAVDSARAALSAGYAKEGFFQSEGMLLKAKETMKQKDYSTSNQSAQQATGLAKAAERSTWKARSEEKIGYLRREIDNLSAQLAGERIQGEWKTARLLLVDAEGSLPSGDYARTYVRAEAAEGAVSVAWAKLREAAEAEMNNLSALSSEIEQLATDATGRQEWSQLFPLITKTKTAFEQGDYRTVFQSTDAGKVLAAQVNLRVKQHNVASRKGEIQATLATYSQNGLAAMAPEVYADLERRVAAVDPLKAGADYEGAIETLENLKNETGDLPRKADMAVDRNLAFAKRTLTEARDAGALRYIREQYVKSADGYQYALGYPRGGDYHELARLVRDASVSSVAALNGTMAAIDEKDYRETITDYMFQLTSLLGRWPFANEAGTGKIAIEVVLAARTTSDVDVYRELQSELPVEEFKTQSAELYSTILDIRPPASLAKVHREVVGAFRTVAEAADLFQKFGEYSLYPRDARVRFLRQAYAKLNEMDEYSVGIKAMLQGQEVREKSRLDIFRSDRGLDIRNYMWTTYGNDTRMMRGN